MKSLFTLFATVALAILSAGCDTGPKSGKGFRLPEGDIERGKTAFIALKCHSCHRVEGVNLPSPTSIKPAPAVSSGEQNLLRSAPAPTMANSVALGGELTWIRTYGELVTSVINPSHGLAPAFKKEQITDGKLSPMPEFNEVMTVAQMIDLVAFLQSRYKKLEPH